jgi:limonene 1,2-monooxygenase
LHFGIFSNGFRLHTTASATYEEDLQELILADQLGYRDAWISEHHGEPVYVDRVDTLPIPELLICKAAGLTRQIRMGPAVKVAHLYHPMDTAIQAAITDHLTGGRYMFGFGSGFSNPIFSEERGLPFEERYPRMLEALDLILKCWSEPQPFDWDGRFWSAKQITALPRPLQAALPIAVATETEDTIQLAAERGYTLLSAGFEPPDALRRKADKYARWALAAGHERPLERLTVARLVYVADSVEEAIADLRPAVTEEMGYQKTRGLFNFVLRPYQLPRPIADLTFDDLVELGIYMVGDPDTVYQKLKHFYDASGGFGTLLLFAGKSWATRDKRLRSLTRFMEEVAPRLAPLAPDRLPDAVPA